MANYHILIEKETNKWNVQKEDSQRSSGSADIQKAAEKLQSNIQPTPAAVKSEFIALIAKSRTTPA